MTNKTDLASEFGVMLSEQFNDSVALSDDGLVDLSSVKGLVVQKYVENDVPSDVSDTGDTINSNVLQTDL